MNAVTIAKREPKRSRVFLSAEVNSGNGPLDARIRDISATGALIECDLGAASGSTVTIRCGEATIRGHVAWVERGWFGVEFNEPLVVDRLVDLAGVGMNVSAPRTYRAGDPLY